MPLVFLYFYSWEASETAKEIKGDQKFPSGWTQVGKCSHPCLFISEELSWQVADWNTCTPGYAPLASAWGCPTSRNPPHTGYGVAHNSCNSNLTLNRQNVNAVLKIKARDKPVNILKSSSLVFIFKKKRSFLTKSSYTILFGNHHIFTAIRPFGPVSVHDGLSGFPAP